MNTNMTERKHRILEAAGGRRGFLQSAGVAAMGAALVGVLSETPANAQRGAIDPAVLNFALNLEYLEGEFYSFGITGASITAQGVGITGVGTQGNVIIKANPKVPFTDPLLAGYLTKIASDEITHVRFLRTALGGAAIARPAIDLLNSFNSAAQNAGLGNTFDPFADQLSFLVGAFIFEDVGVTAYRGAAPLLTNKNYLSAAAGILAVEAYHAGTIRSTLDARGVFTAPNAISALRAKLSGAADDQGIGDATTSTQNGNTTQNTNVVPVDANALAFARTTRQVLNIVYGAQNATSGLFFPAGVNGAINS